MKRLLPLLLAGCGTLYEGRDAAYRGDYMRAWGPLVEAIDDGDLDPADELEARSLLLRCAIELGEFGRADSEVLKAAGRFRVVPIANVRGDPIGLHLIRAERARRASESEDPETATREITTALVEIEVAYARLPAGNARRYVSLVRARLCEQKAQLHLKHASLGRREMIAKAREMLRIGIETCREHHDRHPEFHTRLKSMEALLAALPRD